MPRKPTKKSKKGNKKPAIKPVKVRKQRKSRKPRKSTVVKKTKIVSVSTNQLEDLKAWLKFYAKDGKLPHSRIVCTNCKNDFVSLKGIAISHAMKAFDGDMTKVLTKSVCKACKKLLAPPEEKPEKVVKVETQQEREERYDRIRATIPKIDIYRTREPIDITKDKDMCKNYTSFACHRPDIYLDYGCDECKLSKNCACPIKKLNHKPERSRKKHK